jgi:lysozyme family protein
MDFEFVVEEIIRHEGGLVNHPSDPGGLTKYGISQRAYPNLDIMNLSMDDAKEIYRKDYWEKCRLDEVQGSLRLIIMDGAVNHGINRAIRLLQEVVNLTTDGIMGPMTIKRINSLDAKNVVRDYALRRHSFYTSLSTWDSFGKGWSRRLLDIAINSAITK